MFRIAIAIVFGLPFFLSGSVRADEPSKEKKKPVALTKEWLIGTWRHPKDATITLTFRRDGGGGLSKVAFVAGMFSATSTSFDYVIDAKTNRASMDQGKAHIGTVERTADDKLRVNAPGDGMVNISFERAEKEKLKK